MSEGRLLSCCCECVPVVCGAGPATAVPCCGGKPSQTLNWLDGSGAMSCVTVIGRTLPSGCGIPIPGCMLELATLQVAC